MKTLIVEFQTSGHYPEYLKHILNQINEERIVDRFLIFLSPFLKKHIKSFEDLPVYNSIQFFDESQAIEYGKCNNTKQMANLILSQIFKINKTYLFNQVLFLNLNLVLRNPNILNPFKNLPFNFSGILMNSPYRIRHKKENNLLIFKRELPLRLLVKNKNCLKVWILNDKKGFQFYKRWSAKIGFVIDPVKIEKASAINICKYHDIPKDTMIFTQIGKLGVYKGSLDILNAISFLKHDILKSTHFLFVGKVNRSQEPDHNIFKVIRHQKNVSLRDEFVKDEDFSAYVEQSHVIIIANKNVENSSGIVNHCLANNKVVIAPDKGYYKEAFMNYEAVVSYNDEFTLNDAIYHAYKNYENLQHKAQSFDSKQFIGLNSPEIFARTLLNQTVGKD